MVRELTSPAGPLHACKSAPLGARRTRDVARHRAPGRALPRRWPPRRAV